MSRQQVSPFDTAASFTPQRAAHLGVAVASAPLWGAYLAAASAGAAWWWMTAWTRRAPAFSFALPSDRTALRPEPAGRKLVLVEAEPHAEPRAVEPKVVETKAVELKVVETAPAVEAAPAVDPLALAEVVEARPADVAASAEEAVHAAAEVVAAPVEPVAAPSVVAKPVARSTPARPRTPRKR
jgi:hypothetical protein